ncbi:MAG: hypothetical protein ABI759_18805, partial [Candidatus Solibacter sp.]
MNEKPERPPVRSGGRQKRLKIRRWMFGVFILGADVPIGIWFTWTLLKTTNVVYAASIGVLILIFRLVRRNRGWTRARVACQV